MGPVNFVSIEESEDRRSNLRRQFSEYGMTDLVPHIFKRWHECGHELTGKFVKDLHENSKGPVTSHIKAIKKWYDSTDEEYAFFCEDDLSLETVEHWGFTWEEFTDRLPKDWECVQLTWIRPSPTRVELRNRLWDDWNAAAYLIKRDYAKRLLAAYYVDGNRFNLEINDSDLIPIVENILFNGLGVVYNIPLFVEDVRNVSSTYFGKDPTEVNGQGEYHWDSHDWVSGWWRARGRATRLEDLTKTPHIYGRSQFGEDWFSYPKLYKSMVQKFPSGSRFVEVGSWKGKSSAFMAVEIANSGKDIEFYCVDNWSGSSEHAGLKLDSLFKEFKENMKPLERYYKPVKSDSLVAARSFDDDSLDFVFIDASHEYEDVKNDILAWLPKVRKGGVLAGHDYYVDGEDYYPGVKRAVDECLRDFDTLENCFVHKKE